MHNGLLGLASLLAMSSILIARWAVVDYGISARLAGTLAFSVAWIALSPWAHQRSDSPRWVYWARGAWISIIVWVAISLTR
jgi:hypothetical protein